MNLMRSLQWASALAAFGSAALWWLSAIKPTIWLPWLGGPPAEVARKVVKQARYSAAAAVLTGVSAALQGIALALHGGST